MDRRSCQTVDLHVSVTFRLSPDADPDRHVNVANANARHLLAALGLPGADEPQPTGSAPAAEVARRCMRLANADVDRGADVEVIEEPGRARFVLGGRPVGYLQERALDLWRLALAAPPGAMVSWE